MIRILRKLFLTTIFAVFASQASAMFIQPDWFDPTQPGVGTNRYAYSHNDPINKLDPLGNEAWDLTRGQEESDRANAEAAQDALDRADRIRERGTFWDGLRDDLGLDDYWSGRADNHASRIGKSWGERAVGDAVTGVEIGSLAAGGGVVVQGGKSLLKGGISTAKELISTLARTSPKARSLSAAATPTVLQTGGRTLSKRTVRGLNEHFDENLSKGDWGRALEDLKSDLGLRNDFHGKIFSDGSYGSSIDDVLGNIGHYLP